MSEIDMLIAGATGHNSHGTMDTDRPFVIDVKTRRFSNLSNKYTFVQYDHNSESISFECNRYIDGHDMMLCNVIRVEYLAVDVPGTYEVTDIKAVSGDKVRFSWLVSANVTQKIGMVRFCIVFKCVDTDGTEVYRWATEIDESLEVVASMNHDNTFVPGCVDIFAQWREAIFGAGDSVMSNISSAETQALDNISKAETDAVTDIDVHVVDAKSDITDAKNKALQEIPTDYTDLYNTVMDNKSSIQINAQRLNKPVATAIICQSDDGVCTPTVYNENGIVELCIGGNSEQVQTTGAQLIVPVSKRTQNVNAVTVTYENGIITMNGTATASTALALVTIQGGFLPSLEANTTYCLSTEPRNTYEQNKTYVQYWSNVVGIEGQTRNSGYGVFTTGENETGETDANIGIYVEEGVTYNNYSFSVQFEKASAPSPHEPYTGGQPSPSPDYQQDMNSVENATVTVNGKNLYNRNDILATSNDAVYEDGTDWATVEIDNTNGSGTKYVTANVNPSKLLKTNTDYLCVVEVKENSCQTTQYVSSIQTNLKGQFTGYFDTTEIGVFGKVIKTRSDFSDCETMLRTVFAVGAGSKGKVVFRISVLENINANVSNFVYKPYTEQLAPIPFTLRSCGDVADLLYVYSDGTGKLVQRVIELLPTDFDVTGWIGDGYRIMSTRRDIIQGSTVLCTHLPQDNTVDQYSVAGDYTSTRELVSQVKVRFKQSFVNLAECVAYMESKNMRFYVAIQTPIETMLTAEQVQALLELVTFDEVTYFSFDSKVKPTISVKFVADTDRYLQTNYVSKHDYITLLDRVATLENRQA